MWVDKPDLDLTFLESELDRTLAIWKACLVKEDEIMSYSEATAREDLDGDVSSKALSKRQETLEVGIDAILGEVLIWSGLN